MATTGARGAISALGLILTSGVAAASDAALAMGEALVREARAELGKAAHPAGSPSPSGPGNPPAMVTGRLRDSVSLRVLAPGTVQVGAVTPYARIQELGGPSGRGGATELPPRPYLLPAWEKVRVAAVETALEVITEAIQT